MRCSPKYYAEQRQHKQASQPAFEIPLLGKIAAGTPVEAMANPETLNFADFAGDPNTFALQVRGDSMIEDHICNGDFVLVEKTSTARDGDIVVGLVDGTESTLKRFYLEPGGKVRLQPANSTMKPIYVAQSALAIQGKVLAVLPGR